MAKIIAYSPNGQAYQCDSMAEAKQVQGGFKFKRKKRNGGCGCGGACGNPHCGPKKRNPAKRNPDQPEHVGHAATIGGSTYVDTNFLNLAQKVPGVRLEHMGFGEFYAKTPQGRVDFNRMGGQSFKGQVGRSHLLSGDNDADKWLLGEMRKLKLVKMAKKAKASVASSEKASRCATRMLDWRWHQTQPYSEVTACASTMGKARWGKKANPAEWPWERVERFGGRKAGLDAASAALTNLSQSRKLNESMESYLKRDAHARERFIAAVEYMQRKGAVRGSIAQRYTSRNPDKKSVYGGHDFTHEAYPKSLFPWEVAYTVKTKTGVDYAGTLPFASEASAQEWAHSPNVKKRGYHNLAVRRRNPVGADPRYVPVTMNPKPKGKYLAHEKEEEQIFSSMLTKLPIGVTMKAGKHRVRKLSKGYVVIDGERLGYKDAAAKLHGR
jgi:hypothetical protein